MSNEWRVMTYVGQGFPGLSEVEGSPARAILTVVLLVSVACQNVNSPKARQDFAAAIQDDQIDTVRRMLGAGFNPNQEPSGDCSTPLAAAVVRGNTDTVTLLVEHGAQVNAQAGPDGRTALQCAANLEQDDFEMVAMLLQSGADVNLTGQDGTTALMLAASRGHVETARLLLTAGADVQARSAAGKTAIEMAAAQKQAEVVSLLSDAGAKLAVAPAGPEAPQGLTVTSILTPAGTIMLGETWDDARPKIDTGSHIDTYNQTPTRSIEMCRINGQVYRLIFERVRTGPFKLARIEIQ
jgi:ankyrin repeat protein